MNIPRLHPDCIGHPKSQYEINNDPIYFLNSVPGLIVYDSSVHVILERKMFVFVIFYQSVINVM